MRVLIADDHPLVRRGVTELVRSGHPDWDCREAGTLEEAVDCCEHGPIDLVTIDLGMPGMSGPASLAIFRRFPHVKVVVLTGSDDRSSIVACLGAGMRGYLLKSAAADHLLHALEIVLEGGIYLPSALTSVWQISPAVPALQPLYEPSIAPLGSALTERQREVLELLSEGCSTKEIARRMNLGIGTVKVHLAGIYKGLGARNRMEAIVKAGRLVAA